MHYHQPFSQPTSARTGCSVARALDLILLEKKIHCLLSGFLGSRKSVLSIMIDSKLQYLR
jgi:hypothetical protein